MRILQINNYHFLKGGADRVYFNTSDLLRKYGHEVINFSSLNPLNEANEHSQHFIEIRDNRNSNLKSKLVGVRKYIYNKDSLVNLNNLIQKTRPDVAHIHLFYGGLTSSILKTLKNNGIPIAQTVHDYRYLCPANAFLDKTGRICEKCKNRFYLQCSVFRCLEGNVFYSSILSLEAYVRKYLINPFDYIDHFIFVSEFSRKKHIEFNKAFEKKSSHLYNFTFIPESTPGRKGKGYLLFFGRLSYEKGIINLLESMKYSSLKLLIAGTGPLQHRIEKISANSKNIIYLGYKTTNELNELIRDSAFTIVPSEWYENNPMTILESYAQAKPVLGARIGGIPEIVGENQTGFLFDSGSVDDMRRVLKVSEQASDAKYSEMSKNARKYAVENFSHESHYKRLMQIYYKIIR